MLSLCRNRSLIEGRTGIVTDGWEEGEIVVVVGTLLGAGVVVAPWSGKE